MSVFLAAASKPVAVLFLCGRPLDNGGAGADGVNSSFSRNILSRSIWQVKVAFEGKIISCGFEGNLIQVTY